MGTRERVQEIRQAEAELEKAWAAHRVADEEYLRSEYQIWFHQGGREGWTHQEMPPTRDTWHAVCRAWQRLQELYAQYGYDAFHPEKSLREAMQNNGG